MNIAKFLVLGLAVGGMLFTCTMAKGNLKNKIDTFALVKKKGSKEETHESQRDSYDSDMLSSNKSPEQLIEDPLNMKSLNMDQGADINTNT